MSSSSVVDCGFVKLRGLDERCASEVLMRVKVSKAGADQRAGRAGRIRPGKAFRLYPGMDLIHSLFISLVFPESEYEKLLSNTIPEIQRCHLASMILQLKALGIANLHKFHYISVSSVISVNGRRVFFVSVPQLLL